MATTLHRPGPGHYFGPDSQGFNASLWLSFKSCGNCSYGVVRSVLVVLRMGKQMFSKCRSAPEVSLPRTGGKPDQNYWAQVICSQVGRTGKRSPFPRLLQVQMLCYTCHVWFMRLAPATNLGRESPSCAYHVWASGAPRNGYSNG